jgi:DNA-binding protein HU-beta
MTKAELVNELALSTGYDKKTVGVIVEALISSVKNHMIEGENIYIRGFGSLITRMRAAKMARNILKQTSVAVPAHRIPDFKPAAEFKLAVRNSKK